MVKLLVGSQLGRSVAGGEDVVTSDLACRSAQGQVAVMQLTHGRYEIHFTQCKAPLYYFFTDLRDAGCNLTIGSTLPDSQ